MDDNYDSYDFQSGPDVASTPVSSGDAAASSMGAMDNSGPVGTQAELSQLLYGDQAPNAGMSSSQNDAPYVPSNDTQQAAAPVSAPAAGPMAQVFNAAKDSQLANEQGQSQNIADSLKEQPGAISQLLKGLGISGDLSNPRNLESMMKLLMGAGGILNTLNRKGTAQNGMSLQEMRQAASPNGSSFNPQQQAMADNYFNNSVGNFASRPRQYAADMQSPIVAGRGTNGMVPAKFADGGMVNTGAAIDPTNMAATNPSQYPYQMAQPMPAVNNNYADGGKVDNGKFVSDGALSLVHGLGGGQDDLVHAKLSPGEYVMDADTVASLGDGNNAHGAKVLDAWREQLRAHKRSADSDSIPPQAKEPNHYLKGGALSAVYNSKGK